MLDWTVVQQDAGVPPVIGPDFIDITTDGSQTRNLWYNKRQDHREFAVSFSYESIGTFGSDFDSSDVLFIVQNDPNGRHAGGNFAFNNISPGAGIRLRVRDGETLLGFFRDGAIGSGQESVAPLSAINEQVDVEIAVSRNFLTVTITDGVNDPFIRTFILDPALEQSFNSINSVVGLGAFTSANGTRQRVSNFQFDSVFDVMLGDINQDGCVDLLDVAPLVDLISDGNFQFEGDINNDGNIDLLDVAPFVDLLTS